MKDSKKEDFATELEIDFLRGAIGYRVRHHKLRSELLAKAVGIKGNYKPTVVDATAGLGRDSFILALLGCKVVMLERCKEVALLLSTALAQLQNDDVFSKKISLALLNIDAKNYFTTLPLSEEPEVIYLDPMFPERKKSALVKKEMRLLRKMVGEDEDAPVLLTLALKHARKRVVVKRPRLAPPLGDHKPDFVLQGKAQRFDIYLIKKPWGQA